MITRAHCTRFVGQHVVFSTTDGVMHHGILHGVTHDGVFVRPISGTTTRLATLEASNDDDVQLLDNAPKSVEDATEVFFFPFFFPFLALAFLSPWAWWW